tara:strand:+ start:1949 stop:2155 length:207 start_codon:yes stop_codon:yes gene_type:complete
MIVNKHFVISMIKSIVRIVSGMFLILSGWYLYGAENFTDLLLLDAGVMLMYGGLFLILAEGLGILEEL